MVSMKHDHEGGNRQGRALRGHIPLLSCTRRGGSSCSACTNRPQRLGRETQQTSLMGRWPMLWVLLQIWRAAKGQRVAPAAFQDGHVPGAGTSISSSCPSLGLLACDAIWDRQDTRGRWAWARATQVFFFSLDKALTGKPLEAPRATIKRVRM